MTPIVLLNRLNCNQNTIPVSEEIELKLEEDFTIEIDKFEIESNASYSEETSYLHMATIITYNTGNNDTSLDKEVGGGQIASRVNEINTNIILTSTSANDRQQMVRL